MIKRPDRATAFPIVGVAAKNPQDKHLRQAIRETILRNDGACYDDMEFLLMGQDATGSRQFDQAYAVQILLDHDVDGDGFLNESVDATNLTHRMLWNKLYSVLGSIGYEMSQGRLIGVKAIEDKSTANSTATI